MYELGEGASTWPDSYSEIHRKDSCYTMIGCRCDKTGKPQFKSWTSPPHEPGQQEIHTKHTWREGWPKAKKCSTVVEENGARNQQRGNQELEAGTEQETRNRKPGTGTGSGNQEPAPGLERQGWNSGTNVVRELVNQGQAAYILSLDPL
ncbi:hypothetical protein TNIN_354001 [Trichonephila inaurata madagascariensis]|uniref:Uncharacterized protein n=1 Tax=Trichonephila inaurata madagascariensis TaxID=2747483 RepID=A0A8X7C5V9_9ARAC|nr:hypothetical protein TNIN_354001 [Trichonephila inaurata madagascariensis]